MESYVLPAISCVIALIALVSTINKDGNEGAASHAEVITKLDFIINDTKDLKAEMRSSRDEISRLRTKVEHATERAEAAHRRLDRAGIDSSHDEKE